MNLSEQADHIASMEDFLNFMVQLAMDAKEHPEQWANKNVTDYLGQMASWIDDCHIFEKNIDWDSLDYQAFAKILYMGKIYE